jgi:hypothetical protein
MESPIVYLKKKINKKVGAWELLVPIVHFQSNAHNFRSATTRIDVLWNGTQSRIVPETQNLFPYVRIWLLSSQDEWDI